MEVITQLFLERKVIYRFSTIVDLFVVKKGIGGFYPIVGVVVFIIENNVI